MKFNTATISWAPGMPPDSFRLREINLCFPKGAISLVAGEVGSGKTMLLNALLGEVHVEIGTVIFPPASSATSDHTVSYVPQVAWLQSVSIRCIVAITHG